MTATLVLAFAFMIVIVAAMAIGVTFGRKPISGSCGGMKALGMNVECEICGGNPNLCETESKNAGDGRSVSRSTELGFDATKSRR